MPFDPRQPSQLLKQLETQPAPFEFIQAVRLLLANQAQQLNFKAELAPLGPEAEIQSLEQREQQWDMTLCLEALSGARGVLPDYFYQQLLKHRYQESSTMQDFLSIFDQRAFEIGYRSRTYGALVTQQTNDKKHHDSATRQNLLPSSILPCFEQAVALPEVLSKLPGTLRYGLLLQMKDCHPDNLVRLLKDYFGCDFVVSFGQISHSTLPKDSLTRLGQRKRQNNQLNRAFVLGKKAKLYQRVLQVKIKPANREHYYRLKAKAEFTNRLNTFIKAFIGDCSRFELCYLVKQSYLSPPRLGRDFQIGKKHYLHQQTTQTKTDEWVTIAA